MASNVSQVDLTGLGQVVNGQDMAVEGGRTQFKVLLGEAQGLSGSWTGQAATVFQGALAELQQNGDGLFNALNNMSALMAETRAGFGNAHGDTTDTAAQFAANMTPVNVTGLPGI